MSARVVVVTQDDPLLIPHFFRHFLPAARRAQLSVVSVVVLPSFGQGRGRGLRNALTLYGPLGTARLGSAVLAGRVLPGVGAGRLLDICRSNEVPTQVVDRVRDSGAIGLVRSLQPDVLLSLAASQRISPDLLALPRFGAFNIHCGRLPDYKGMMPVFWSRLNGERELTLTAHRMGAAIDEGHVLLERKLAISGDEPLHDTMIRCKVESAALAVDAIALCLTGAPGTPVAPGGAYRSFPKRPDVARYRATVGRIL